MEINVKVGGDPVEAMKMGVWTVGEFIVIFSVEDGVNSDFIGIQPAIAKVILPINKNALITIRDFLIHARILGRSIL